VSEKLHGSHYIDIPQHPGECPAWRISFNELTDDLIVRMFMPSVEISIPMDADSPAMLRDLANEIEAHHAALRSGAA
jgi:hypothetical protein